MNAVLLSGGIDSVALAYWHRPAVVITVDYGQVAAPAEVRAAAAIAAALNIRHEVIRADCSAVGCGDMAPSRRAALNAAPSPEWWPYRNQLVVTLAAARAVALGVRTLLIGTVRSDSRFADGRPEFMEALNRLLSVQEGRLGLTAPAIALSSADLVRVSGVPLDLLAWSHSCHVSENACGRCRGCQKRAEVWQELGWGDSELLLNAQRLKDGVGGVGVEARLELGEQLAGDGREVADAGHRQ